MKRRLEVEPDFYSQEVDDILDALDDFSDGFSDHEGESSQPEEVQPSKNVKSSAISEIKEEILKEKEGKIGPLKNERLKCQEDLSEIQVKLNEAKDQGGDTRQKNQVFDYIVNHLKKKNKVPGTPPKLDFLEIT